MRRKKKKKHKGLTASDSSSESREDESSCFFKGPFISLERKEVMLPVEPDHTRSSDAHGQSHSLSSRGCDSIARRWLCCSALGVSKLLVSIGVVCALICKVQILISAGELMIASELGSFAHKKGSCMNLFCLFV